jgi:hypothetical protein
LCLLHIRLDFTGSESLTDRYATGIGFIPLAHTDGVARRKTLLACLLDSVSVAETAAQLTLDIVMCPARLARLTLNYARHNKALGLASLLTALDKQILKRRDTGREREIQQRACAIASGDADHALAAIVTGE